MCDDHSRATTNTTVCLSASTQRSDTIEVNIDLHRSNYFSRASLVPCHRPRVVIVLNLIFSMCAVVRRCRVCCAAGQVRARGRGAALLPPARSGADCLRGRGDGSPLCIGGHAARRARRAVPRTEGIEFRDWDSDESGARHRSDSDGLHDTAGQAKMAACSRQPCHTFGGLNRMVRGLEARELQQQQQPQQ